MLPNAFIFIAALATSALGGGITTFSLSPAIAIEGEAVTFRIDNTDGCFLAESHEVTRNGADVEMRITQTDELPCLPSQLTPIFYPLGSFAAGEYQVRVVVCVNAPDPCREHAALRLSVVSQASPLVARIPALSVSMLAFVVVAMGGVAFLHSRKA